MWNLPSTCYQKERFQRLDEGFSSMSVIHLPPPPNSPAIMRMSYDSDCLGEPNFSENLYVIRNPVGWTRKIQTAAPVLSFTYTAQGTPSFTQGPMLITSSSPVSVQVNHWCFQIGQTCISYQELMKHNQNYHQRRQLQAHVGSGAYQPVYHALGQGSTHSLRRHPSPK